MFNFIQSFITGVAGLVFLFWLLSKWSGWDRLSNKYKIETGSPGVFIEGQQGIFKSSDDDRWSHVIRTLNIGVSEEGLYLYLFKPSPYNILFPSLLIPWEEIEYQRPTENGNKNKPHTFYLGNPKITSLRLYPSTIRKLEEEYGEPIFSNKLGQLN